MKILVTGGTGFTGAALCRRLVGLGHDVTTVHTRESPEAAALRAEGVTTVRGSVTDGALLRRLTEGCDRVFHLAAAFRRVAIGEGAYFDTNVEGTRCVMEAALANEVPRVVHCSTIGVHGSLASIPGDERAPIAPMDYYQRSKWEGEQIARAFADRGLWVSIVRPASIYGPGDLRLAKLFRPIARGRFFVLGDGTTHFHTVYVENLVDGMLLAAETESARGEAYIIADEHSLPLRELARQIGSAVGTRVRVTSIPYAPVYWLSTIVEAACRPLRLEPPLHPRRVKFFSSNRSFDTAKARRELGYVPRVSLAEGLRRTAEWYRAQRII